jgi:hypothetical protein
VFPVHDCLPDGLHVHWRDARRVRLHLERILTDSLYSAAE